MIIHLAQSIHCKSLLSKSEDIFNVMFSHLRGSWGLVLNLPILASSGSVCKSTLKTVDENSPIKPLEAMDLYASSKI